MHRAAPPPFAAPGMAGDRIRAASGLARGGLHARIPPPPKPSTCA